MNPIQNIPGKLTRVKHPFSGWGDKHNGACHLKLKSGDACTVLFSIGEGWEHVSVSKHKECPTWDEMCEIRALFWPDNVWVMQYHPPKDQYVNFHPHCLHLWRPMDGKMPTPQPWQLGPRNEAYRA